MHIVLINPPPAGAVEKHWARFPLLGLAYLAAALRRAGHLVTLLDGKLDNLDSQAICVKALAAGADMVGITCMTVEFPIAAAIATAIKGKHSIPICAGGAHINAVGAEALRECPAFDFGCKGEGEFLFVELLSAIERGLDLRTVDGLLFRSGGEVISNNPRAYPTNYDDLAFPAWDLFKRTAHIPILTHRGCPFRCTFCGHNSGFAPRYRSTDNVISEIADILARYHPEVIRFEDETFGLNVARTKEILKAIVSRGFHHFTRFSAQTRVDRIDEEFVTMLRDANFETLELGVESGNAEVLKRVQKGITLTQVTKAVALAKAAGLRVWCKFILGHPGETVATVRDTLRYIIALNPHQVSVSLMTPYPGTPIHEMAMRGEGGYRLIATDWGKFDKYSSGALELDGLSLGQLKRYQVACYLFLYARNGRLPEFLQVVWAHRTMATSLLVGAARSTLSGWRQNRTGARITNSFTLPPQPRDVSCSKPSESIVHTVQITTAERRAPSL